MNIKTFLERKAEYYLESNVDQPDAVFMAAEISDLRAALASQASKGAVPDGWEIHRIGQTIRVNHEAVGRVFLPRDCRDPSDVVLYHLAESLLIAPSPAQAQPDATEDVKDMSQARRLIAQQRSALATVHEVLGKVTGFSPDNTLRELLWATEGLKAQAQPVEAETHNFQVCQRFDNWLISQGLLLTTHTEEADGPMATALNWIASVEAIRAQPIADPMDWPLPCDVTVGNGTHKKGVPLRSLVARMNVLHGMAKSQPVADAAPDPRVTVAMVQDQLKMAMDLIDTMRSADKMDYEFGRAAGIEEAAKLVEQGQETIIANGHDGATNERAITPRKAHNLTGLAYAAAIRALAAKQGGQA